MRMRFFNNAWIEKIFSGHLENIFTKNILLFPGETIQHRVKKERFISHTDVVLKHSRVIVETFACLPSSFE